MSRLYCGRMGAESLCQEYRAVSAMHTSLPDAMALSDVSAADAEAIALDSECTADDAEALAASAASTDDVGPAAAVEVTVATTDDMIGRSLLSQE